MARQPCGKINRLSAFFVFSGATPPTPRLRRISGGQNNAEDNRDRAIHSTASGLFEFLNGFRRTQHANRLAAGSREMGPFASDKDSVLGG